MTTATPKPTRAQPGPRAIYLYAISRPPRNPKIAALGVDGDSAVEAFSCGAWICWISRVDRGDFADQLAERMQDLDWLAAAGVRHQRVVSELARRGEVLPARFGTVFLSEKSLEADVARRRASLVAAFRRISGAEEWGVKIFATPQPAPPIRARSGREFLQRKAEQLQAAAPPASDSEVRDFERRLRRLARAAAPTGSISGGQRDLVWQHSFLVARTRQKQFLRLIAEFARRWRGQRRLETSGPWPPYSFVSSHGD